MAPMNTTGEPWTMSERRPSFPWASSEWRVRHGVLCSAMWQGTHIPGSAAVYAHLVHARLRGDFLQIDAALIVAQQRDSGLCCSALVISISFRSINNQHRSSSSSTVQAVHSAWSGRGTAVCSVCVGSADVYSIYPFTRSALQCPTRNSDTQSASGKNMANVSRTAAMYVMVSIAQYNNNMDWVSSGR